MGLIRVSYFSRHAERACLNHMVAYFVCLQSIFCDEGSASVDLTDL